MNSQRILIIKPSALGDVATTLPLLCDLHAAHPTAKIDWLIHPAYAPVIAGHNALHQIIPFDRKTLATWYFNPRAFAAFRALLRRLRRNQYDAVIDAQGLLRSGFLARATGAKTRVGFAHAREGGVMFYTHKVYLPEGGTKTVAVDRMRALGVPLGTDASKPAQFRIAIPTLPKVDLPADFVALVPGARWDTKRWPLERFAEIARRLANGGESIVLLGSPDEKPLVDQLAQKMDSPSILNLAGQTSVPDMIALLARARLVIANDSGPLHLAAALNRPVIGLYGPTSPLFVGPYQQSLNVLRHDVPCHPCRRRTCSHHSCMQGLTVETVWTKTTQQLQSR